MGTPSEAKRLERFKEFEASAKKHLRLADDEPVLAVQNRNEDYELRLDDPVDDKGQRIGEGGQIRVRRGMYLCRDSRGEYSVLDEPTFANTHKLFVESVEG